jgi:hypothetical protein
MRVWMGSVLWHCPPSGAQGAQVCPFTTVAQSSQPCTLYTTKPHTHSGLLRRLFHQTSRGPPVSESQPSRSLDFWSRSSYRIPGCGLLSCPLRAAETLSNLRTRTPFSLLHLNTTFDETSLNEESYFHGQDLTSDA